MNDISLPSGDLGLTPKDIGVKLGAVEGIEQARRFFQGQDFAVREDGFLKGPFLPTQLIWLKEYKDSRFKDGAEMPTEEDFYQQVLLATSLYPQVRDGRIQYLFGRGIGTEIALQGKVNGRKKNPSEISYRGHSDFDLYGVDYDVAPDSLEDRRGKEVYTPEFKKVFGGVEYYPLKATKGLRNIPEDLLHQTAETVELGGIPVIIPELEILALDKLLKPEYTPRPEGSDALVLALVYDLDRDKMLDYYERFVISPEQGTLPEEIERRTQSILDRLAYRQHNLEIKVLEQDGISRDEARRKINEVTQWAFDHPEEAEALKQKIRLEGQKAFDEALTTGTGVALMAPNTKFLIAAEAEGINPDIWIPLSETDISDGGEISEDYKDKMIKKVESIEGQEIRNKRYAKLLFFFSQVDKIKTS